MQALIDTLRRHGAAPVVMNGPLTPELWRHHRDHGGCDGLPGHLRRVVDQLDRYFDAMDPAPLSRQERARIESEIYTDLQDRAARRAAEQQLADYLHTVAEALPYFDGEHKIQELAESLATCRTAGVAGQTEQGSAQIAWDHKCGQVRLCPDESRIETQRVAERYVTAMHRWHLEKPGRRRIIYAVLTCPNFEPGRLEHGKRFTLEQFKAWMRHEYAACPVTWRKVAEDLGDGDRRIVPQAVKSRKRKIQAFPSIQGAMVIQEDPLSARDDWNVHLNAFLLIDGRFDYKEARELWGWNVEFRELDASDPAALFRAAMEAVKYSAQIVPTKSEEKRARHDTEAPAMTEWPVERWAEWWAAGKGFRRLRSYGELYRLTAPCPACGEAVRLSAETCPHCQHSMADEAEAPLVRWLGRVSWDGAGYRVDLIPENNFSGSWLSRWSSSGPAGSGPPGAGPPGSPGWQ